MWYIFSIQKIANCKVEQLIRTRETADAVHLRKLETFYDRKRAAKKEANKSEATDAMTMEYIRHFPFLNIQKNYVYYRWLNVLCSTTGSGIYFYIYTVAVGKKEADRVYSYFHHFYY